MSHQTRPAGWSCVLTAHITQTHPTKASQVSWVWFVHAVVNHLLLTVFDHCCDQRRQCGQIFRKDVQWLNLKLELIIIIIDYSLKNTDLGNCRYREWMSSHLHKLNFLERMILTNHCPAFMFVFLFFIIQEVTYEMKRCACKHKHTDTEWESGSVRGDFWLSLMKLFWAVRILWFHVSILIIFIDQKNTRILECDV